MNYANSTHLSASLLATPLIAGAGGSDGYLRAVSYGAYNTLGIRVYHSRGAYAGTASGSADADIALGDDMGVRGERYQIAIGNTQLYLGGPIRQAILSQYQLRNVHSGTPFFNNQGAVYLSDGYGIHPRTDFFADTSVMIDSVTPSFHRAIACWGEDDDTLHIALADFANVITNVNSPKYAFYMGDTIRNIDVAGQLLVDSNKRIGHIGFSRDTAGKTYIYHATMDCSASTPYIMSIEMLGAETGRISNLRIEAMALYSNAVGGVSWGMVYENASKQIIHHNSQVLAATRLNRIAGDGVSPSIAAGMGFPYPADTPEVGNKYYTVAWISSGNDVLSQYVDARTGIIDNKDIFYVINDTPAREKLSITSSPNKGNRIFAAWSDNTNIWARMADTTNPTGQILVENTEPDTFIVNYANSTHLSASLLATPLIAGAGGSDGYLRAVSYGAYNTLGIRVYHSRGAYAGTASGSADADIALGDDMGVRGERYQIAIANTQLYLGGPVRQAILSQYQLRNVHSGTPFFNNQGAVYLSDGYGIHPRTDFFADTSVMIDSVTPSFHRAIACWGEDDDTLHIALADFANVITNVNSPKYAFYMGDTIRNIDVAGQLLVDSNKRIGHIGFSRDTAGKTYIYHATMDCSASTPYITSIEMLGAETGRISNLRIEAMALYSNAVGGVSWGMVYENASKQIIHHNSQVLAATVLNAIGGDGVSPSISAGMGFPYPADTPSIANKYYTVAWINTGDDVLSQYINARTGMRTDAKTFYVINDTPARTRVAITSSPNKGNRILAAWSDNTDIWSKMIHSGNAPVSMSGPASTGSNVADALLPNTVITTGDDTNNGTTERTLKANNLGALTELSPDAIYPNPVQDRLYLPESAGKYFCVYNMAGRKMALGIIVPEGLDVSPLPTGTYMITITDEQGNVQHAKFVKQ